MQIVIDTNFILSCIKQKIPIFDEIEESIPGAEIVVPTRVIEELLNLTKKADKLKERESASVALQLLEKKKIKTLDLEGEVDDSIVLYALSNKDVIVATLDRGIKERIKNQNKVLAIRNKNRVALV
jgi:rRNA-processing protein FCF1